MPTAKLTKNQLFTVVCLALALGTFILYWPVTRNGFTNFDDDAYITGNPHVKAGLTWPGIVWAFKSGYAANWHPLTWISHMADCQFFGLNPAGHHLVNLLFHTANTLLLFVLLKQLTGALWRSAFVAALFAWHPLHVESVAWAAERKDVLSAFFWLLTLLAYTRYTRTSSLRSFLFYFLSLVLFACGLMSKPMVVTLPFVLLLLDFWPLQRFPLPRMTLPDPQSNQPLQTTEIETANPTRKSQPVPATAWLLIEKIPFFALSVAGCIVTYLVQKKGGAFTEESLSFRLSNALWAYARYIGKVFWPADLAIVYPFREHGLAALAIGSAAMLAVCSFVFIGLACRRPYLMVGWFWFLGMLVPVIGIVSIGSASMADRYAYLPSIGLFILVTWALADIFQSHRTGRALLGAAAVGVLTACIVLTSIQIRYWRSSITLFRHALAVTTDNYVACACLGQALETTGDNAKAIKYCREAVRLAPDYPAGQFFLGVALWNIGDTAQALKRLDAATQADPDDPGFQYNFAKFLVEHGFTDRAVAHFIAAIADNPDFAEAHNALGKTFLKQGKPRQAADELAKASALDPNNAQFHYDLGTVLLSNSKPGPSIEQFRNAIRLKPDFAMAHENLAVALATEGKLEEAIPEFAAAAKLDPGNAAAHFSLGLACLNNHQPAQAAEEFRRELQLEPRDANSHYRLAQALREQDQWAEAISQYRQALQLAPGFTQAKKELDEALAGHPQSNNPSK